MNNKKNLVILTPGFPKDESDSTCLPMQQQLVKALKDDNPELNIIILSFQYPYHTNRYQWFGIPVIPFNGQNKGGLLRLLLRKKLTSVLKEIHNDTPITGLLSFWYGECAAIGKQFAGKHRLPHLCWILGQDAKGTNKYPKRIRLRPKELMAVSDATRLEFEKNHGIQPQYVVPPGIDDHCYEAAEKGRSTDILGVGSLIPLKQYEIFVDIVAAIKKQIPGVKAMLIGKGPEKERLEELVKNYGLQANLELPGELPYDEVLDKMQRAKVFLHPSSAEGFSGVCLEALFAGAHVISFCQPMHEDIEQWHIVSSKEEMLNKTVNILSDPAVTYKSVMFGSIGDTAEKMSALFFQGK